MRPWRDRSGKISALKTTVFVLLFVPALWLAIRYADNALGPRPLNETIHQTGLWAIRLLLLSLAITPLRQALGWNALIQVRRMVGVAAFAYVAVHLALYIGDQAFDLVKVASEILLRIYLLIGFVALLGLAALAATSTDGMLRRLGGRTWRRLHSLTYPIAVLALAHHFMQTKLDVFEPTVMAGLFLWMMAWRLLAARRPAAAAQPVGLTAITLAAGVLTAVLEAAYFRVVNGIDPALILAANISLDVGLRPAPLVVIAGATVILAAVGATLVPRQRRRAAPAPAMTFSRLPG